MGASSIYLLPFFCILILVLNIWILFWPGLNACLILFKAMKMCLLMISIAFLKKNRVSLPLPVPLVNSFYAHNLAVIHKYFLRFCTQSLVSCENFSCKSMWLIILNNSVSPASFISSLVISFVIRNWCLLKSSLYRGAVHIRWAFSTESFTTFTLLYQHFTFLPFPSNFP